MRSKNESGDKEAIAAPQVPRAVLTLKTFDPESGVCLKFKTDKAADVGRLVGGLGRLGRHMVALPSKTEGWFTRKLHSGAQLIYSVVDVVMEDAIPNTEKTGQEHISTADATSANIDGKPQQPGGGKKKKKGKK